MTQREDEDELTRAILQLASKYGRYGYRRITALLRALGWDVGKDRVQTVVRIATSATTTFVWRDGWNCRSRMTSHSKKSHGSDS